ncbi:hypothetical protein Tco_1562369 [Tanacetum coccineum]
MEIILFSTKPNGNFRAFNLTPWRTLKIMMTPQQKANEQSDLLSVNKNWKDLPRSEKDKVAAAAEDGYERDRLTVVDRGTRSVPLFVMLSVTVSTWFDRQTPATEEASTGPSAQPHDDASANIVRDSPSLVDAKTGADIDKTNSRGDNEILQIGEEQREDVDNQVNLEEKTVELDQGQARSDPDVSSNGNVDTEVKSMVTVLIRQASSFDPSLSTPVIDLSPPCAKHFRLIDAHVEVERSYKDGDGVILFRQRQVFPKGEEDEVFGMQIPKELIMNNIRNAPYYNAYLEMVAKHDQKTAAEEGGKKKSATKADKSKKPATVKQLKPKIVKEKSSKLAPASKHKVTQEKPANPSLAKHPKWGKVQKIRKGKSSLQLIDELNLNLNLNPNIKAQGQAYVGGVAIREPIAKATRPLPVTPATKEASTGPSAQPQDNTSANIVRDSPSLVDAKIGADIDKTNSGGDTEILQIEDVSSNGNVDTEVKSMGTILIHQASSFDPPLSKPVIDLSPPKLVSTPTVFTATTTTTTTTLPLPPPLQQQSTTDSELAARVTTLKKKFSDFEQKSKTLDNTTQNLRSRVFTLELQDLPHKINQTVNDVVKEAVHVAFQALLQDRFRELPEADMKEILH